MNKLMLLPALALCAGLSVAASSDAVAPPREAQISFANKDGIVNWQVVDDKTVLVKDRGGRWYKATLFNSCFDLPAASQRLEFKANANGTFDKFSTIIVRDQRCQLTSFVASTAPPKKSKADSPPPAAAQATTP
jgi:Family of unknown function (DUF6491)